MNLNNGGSLYVTSKATVSVNEFRNIIRQYYNDYGRSFPWRETRDPYHILVSEMMLQQTQTERVVPRYISWLNLFPDVSRLAEASFAEVLSAWVGLGYNRRAKFLHETARIITDTHSGVFPQDPGVLQTLPGIGHYTANAVSTFAFDRPNVFIETNIRSVFLFFFFPDSSGVKDNDILAKIEETLDHEDPRGWYYALMDYGADLKKRIPNPNRQSAGYTRQSRFEGSIRQTRGCILRYLAAREKGTAESIAHHEGIDEQRIRDVLPALIGEGMVCEHEGFYHVSY